MPVLHTGELVGGNANALAARFRQRRKPLASLRTLTDTVPEFTAKDLLEAGLMTEDLFLIALGQAIQTWTGHDRVTIEQLNHGRRPWTPGIDASGSIRWFTRSVPVSLDLQGSPDLPTLVRQLHTQSETADDGGLAYWPQTARELEMSD